ncbi:MAG: phosphodiester glycosidase family protein, partial [Anaerolineales bacterium]
MVRITKINSVPKNGQISLFTPQYGHLATSPRDGVQILVEVTRPTAILPIPARATGVVRDIRINEGPFPLPIDHVVINARGNAVEGLLKAIRLGDIVGFSSEVIDHGYDCKQADPNNWTKAYASVAGSYNFLRDGDLIPENDEGALYRHPRTAVCLNDTYVYFVIVDGRRDSYSIGMTIDELGMFCKNSLDAT